jgi:NADH:ubiquinone oxidoreductase subunit 4 (subunit M)
MTMSPLSYGLAALFLPLFPFSIVFGHVLSGLRRPGLRALALLAWPQMGIWVLSHAHGGPPPAGLIVWAAGTALFYAYRALALRDAGTWIGFVAVSAWALLWIGPGPQPSALDALGLSLPLALAALLTGLLERRFGAAHTALRLGLAASAPRLSALFVLAILATVATPVFPNFFVLVAIIAGQAPAAPALALTVLAVWMLWAWSGARLLQGIVVGPARPQAAADLAPVAVWVYAALFCGLAGAGLTMGGLLL